MEENNHAVIFNCQLKNEQSGETADGVTLVIDGELKTVIDSLQKYFYHNRTSANVLII